MYGAASLVFIMACWIVGRFVVLFLLPSEIIYLFIFFYSFWLYKPLSSQSPKGSRWQPSFFLPIWFVGQQDFPADWPLLRGSSHYANGGTNVAECSLQLGPCGFWRCRSPARSGEEHGAPQISIPMNSMWQNDVCGDVSFWTNITNEPSLVQR